MTIGERIRVLREGRELSQGALGELVHMTQRKVSYLETGKCEPSVDDIRELCLLFNVSADYLLGLKKGLNYPER